jgi:hypothetical protein
LPEEPEKAEDTKQQRKFEVNNPVEERRKKEEAPMPNGPLVRKR